MSNPILLKPDDPIIKKLNFKPYRSIVERRVERFIPPPNQPQNIEVETPWGESLTANSGDYLVSELDSPTTDRWPVEASIFEETYIETRPGFCVKSALTMLVPLVDAVNGDAEQEVVIETLEGKISVRAGNFYLALGVQGEIWPYPKDKVSRVLTLVEDNK